MCELNEWFKCPKFAPVLLFQSVRFPTELYPFDSCAQNQTQQIYHNTKKKKKRTSHKDGEKLGVKVDLFVRIASLSNNLTHFDINAGLKN